MKEGELWSAEVKNCYLKVEATIIKWRQQFESRGNDLWFESKSWGSDLNESGGNIWKQRQWFESEGLPLESWDNAQRTVKDKKGFPPTSDFEVGSEAEVWVCQMKIFILSLGVSEILPFWAFQTKDQRKGVKEVQIIYNVRQKQRGEA